MKPVILVAVGILIDSEGQLLLNTRPVGKSYEGYWEFPGGKIEPKESAFDALKRELKEEIGIEIIQAKLWLTQQLNFVHSSIRLHFFLVPLWKGEPFPKEGQLLSWQKRDSISVFPILEANKAILRALNLPRKIFYFDPSLDQSLKIETNGWLIITQPADMVAIGEAKASIRLIGKGEWTKQYEGKLDGVLLDETELQVCKKRPSFDWLGAYVKNEALLPRALDLQCDFIITKNPNWIIDTAISLYTPFLEKKLSKISAKGYVSSI